MTSTESTSGSGQQVLRPTRQRRAVAAALQEFDDFRSAQEIHETLRSGGDNVGLSTVYRRCSDRHHHHLVCRSCGATVEVEGPTVERWTRAVAAEHGYADVSHTLEIFGTCSACTP
jgi:Fur family ferric uptake transcriptional regulator